MGIRTERLFPASFRGVEFLARVESQPEAGRKSVLHEYPNSDQRFVEDLGQVVPVFTMDAFVSGDLWRNIASDLEKELNTAGSGKLVMPTFGSRTVYPLPYTKDASQQSVGIISYRLTFAIGNPAAAPEESIPDEQLVFIVGDRSRGLLATLFAAAFAAPALINNAIVAVQDLQNGLDSMLEDLERVITLEFLTDFTKQIKDLGNKVAKLVTTPVDFAKEMIQGDEPGVGLWQTTSEGFGTGGNIDASLLFTEFGEQLLESTEIEGAAIVETVGDETSSNTPYWPEDTQERIDRNENRRTFVRMIRLNALIVSYEQLAAATYNTTDEINKARVKVETAYKAIMLDGAEDKDAIQAENQMKILIESLRSNALAVLQQKEQEVFGLTELDYGYPISRFVLAYNLYGEQFTNDELLTERSEIIRGLNPDKNGTEMKGILTVLETEGI